MLKKSLHDYDYDYDDKDHDHEVTRKSLRQFKKEEIEADRKKRWDRESAYDRDHDYDERR